MLIANPIYDIVFKYMMDDQKVAKIFLSALLDNEVLSLEPRPTERLASKGDGIRGFLLFRMDFCARVRYRDKREELVIIEIQKAKFPTDIMRFRKYLGSEYSNPQNTIKGPDGTVKALPIHSIYFLGHKLEHITSPVIRVKRVYEDAEKKPLRGREEFIESLTHDSVIVQIPFLKKKRQNDIEALLSVFCQDGVTLQNKQMLDVDDSRYPEKYQPVIRRLMKAAAEARVRNVMEIEDDFLSEAEQNERDILEVKQELEEKNKALKEKGKALEESKKTLEEKDKALGEKDKALEEKDRLINELKKKFGVK